MKATGIVRRVDDLGRIVIPKEIRRNRFMRLHHNNKKIPGYYRLAGNTLGNSVWDARMNRFRGMADHMCISESAEAML